MVCRLQVKKTTRRISFRQVSEGVKLVINTENTFSNMADFQSQGDRTSSIKSYNSVMCHFVTCLPTLNL